MAQKQQRKLVDVLLVDDDEGVHFLVERHLRRQQLTLAWCQDSHSAIDFLNNHQATWLVLDQHLPDCTGDALLENLLSKGLLTGTRVSLCSAQMPEPAVCSRVVKLGANIIQKSDITSRAGFNTLLSSMDITNDKAVDPPQRSGYERQ